MTSSWCYAAYKKKALAIAVSLHLVCLVWFASVKMFTSSGASYATTYTIRLQSANTHPTLEEIKPVVQKPDVVVKNRKSAVPARQLRSQKKAATSKDKKASQPSKIDNRGLYSPAKSKSKQAGALLELAGWKWDKVPKPKDTTQAYGKIVFEIKVDANGEIVAIRTLEKTVSPLVEKIYLDALRALTFTKISTLESYAELSVGKVSFILVPK
ncbi:MAG: hypothetical protein K2X94_00250 [Amoebophilaceae bacterium]|nr:hypothetical protein [Amoebophilaceae bacterium]